MIDVEKQIEEVMGLVGRYGNLNYQECDADYREHQSKSEAYAQDQKETFAQIEEKLRALLSSAQSGEQAEKAAKYDHLLPYLCKTCGGYGLVDRRCHDDPLGAEPCPDCNHPAPTMEVEHKALPLVEAMQLGLEAYSYARSHGTGTTNWAYAITRFYERALLSASQPNGEAA